MKFLNKNLKTIVSSLVLLSLLALGGCGVLGGTDSESKAGDSAGGFVSSANVAYADPLATEAKKFYEQNIVIYVGKGCPHCAKVEAHVEDLGYDKVFNLQFKEIYFDRDNIVIYNKEADRLKIPLNERGVPLLIVGNTYIVGDVLINKFLDEQYALWKADNPPVVSQGGDSGGSSGNSVDAGGGGETDTGLGKLTIPVVTMAAIIDAINPCEFAVLIILLTTILASGNRKRALLAGLLFSVAVFVSYLAMGFGLYTAVSSAQFSGVFMKVIGTLAIVLGLFNLKDYFFYGKVFLMEVPMSWRPKMKAILRSVASPLGAFLVGFLISLFLLPCTSGPYLVIIGMLSQKEAFSTAAWLLLYYNLIFVSPMVLITLAVYKGFSTERAEEIRQKRLKTLHLIAGLLLLVMGALILMNFV